MEDSLYNNAKSSKWMRHRNPRILPLTAQLNIRELLAYVVVAALLYTLMHRDAMPLWYATPSRVRIRSAVLPRDVQLDWDDGEKKSVNPGTDATDRTLAETQATPMNTTSSSVDGATPIMPASLLSLREAEDAVVFNLFSVRMTMRDGGVNATILSACEELSNAVIRGFLSMRSSFTRTMKEQVGGGNTNMNLGELDGGFQMNNAFYKWQMSKRDNAFMKYNSCVEKNGNTDPGKACQHAIAQDEWPEVYGTQAFATLRAFVLESAALTSVGKAVFSDPAAAKLEDTDMDIWFSVHSPGMFHGEHNHHFSSIAGTMYLHTGDGSGRIVFLDPRSPHSKTEEVEQAAAKESAALAGEEVEDPQPEKYLFENGRRGVSVEPRDGLLLLFPPWLFHKVEHTVPKTPSSATSSPTQRTGSGTDEVAGDASTDDAVLKRREGRAGEDRSLIAWLWWWISFGEWRERSRIAQADRLARLRKELDRGRDPMWTRDSDAAGFRVAMSFNIGQSWDPSVDLSVADADSKRVFEMLRTNAVSPTRIEKEHWVYVDDDELRESMVRYASAVRDDSERSAAQ